MNFVIVTGLSGAGRTSALKCLEDIGFVCSDNMPPVLIPQFAELMLSITNPPENIAVAVDMRMGEMFESIYDTITKLQQMPELHLSIIFLDASDDTLVKRFSFTRRRHPISGTGKIIEGIWMERDHMQQLKEMADIVLDTSKYNVNQLADALKNLYNKKAHDERLIISVITFGYKRGIPIDADMVFDMRFLPNPYYVPELRKLSGLTKEVSGYVFSHEAATYFLNHLVEIVNYIIPCYLAQYKKQLVIGVGCTGGMHRSVAMGEALYKALSAAGHNVTIEHRDLQLEHTSIASENKEN